MLLERTKAGSRYRLSGRPQMLLVHYAPGKGEWEERAIIPSSTVLTVLRKNERSIRAELKFKDRDKDNLIVRLTFDDNWQDYDLTEL